VPAIPQVVSAHHGARPGGRYSARWMIRRGGSPRPYGMWHENAISHPPREVELG
jgi:hypothetical protein